MQVVEKCKKHMRNMLEKKQASLNMEYSSVVPSSCTVVRQLARTRFRRPQVLPVQYLLYYRVPDK